MESMVPVCDKRYHIYNRLCHFWAKIKKLWNYPLPLFLLSHSKLLFASLPLKRNAFFLIYIYLSGKLTFWKGTKCTNLYQHFHNVMACTNVYRSRSGVLPEHVSLFTVLRNTHTHKFTYTWTYWRTKHSIRSWGSFPFGKSGDSPFYIPIRRKRVKSSGNKAIFFIYMYHSILSLEKCVLTDRPEECTGLIVN